jgi:hypothetical protein
MPYDIPIGNFESRAIVSTSRFETAALNVSQNASKEVWFSLCGALRISAFSAVNGHSNAENAEIRGDRREEQLF